MAERSMPGPRGVPSDVIRDLLRRGLSNAEVNAELIKLGHLPEGKPLTRQYLSQFRSRYGFPASRRKVPGRKDLIPWVVAEADQSHRFYKCLLLVTNDRAGIAIAPKDRDRMDKFVRELFEARAVVHYDRENGWVALPPRPGVDRDLIRDPRLDDDGKPRQWDPRA